MLFRKTKTQRIFVDIDDVLNDFTIHALRRAGCDILSYDQYPAECRFDIIAAANKILGHDKYRSKADFWNLLDIMFWAHLPTNELTQPIMDWAARQVGANNVFLLTSPTIDPLCLAGKLYWIKQNLPTVYHRQYAITPRKFVCAQPGHLLIDDNEENCKVWLKNGGQVKMIPRPWNSAWLRHDKTFSSIASNI